MKSLWRIRKYSMIKVAALMGLTGFLVSLYLVLDNGIRTGAGIATALIVGTPVLGAVAGIFALIIGGMLTMQSVAPSDEDDGYVPLEPLQGEINGSTGLEIIGGVDGSGNTIGSSDHYVSDDTSIF